MSKARIKTKKLQTNKNKIVTIVGARPQFIKAAMLSKGIKERQDTSNDIHEVLIHTGQHFDREMSDIFFDELALQAPHYNLQISSLSHGAMTGKMLEGIENILLKEKPKLVIVYGDTNSTLAGALAAAKLYIPIAHVEAGLRSHNRAMPEEINRILTDRIADQLYCPTKTAINNLAREGITKNVYNVGDIMHDSANYFATIAKKKYSLKHFNLSIEETFVFATLHREINTNDIEKLCAILEGLQMVAAEVKVLLALHPRTRKVIEANRLEKYLSGITIFPPISYLASIFLQLHAEAIITDSGGMQKEAFFFRKPCLTLRQETEWIETVQFGCNQLVGYDKFKINAAWQNIHKMAAKFDETPYGNGNATQKILENILRSL